MLVLLITSAKSVFSHRRFRLQSTFDTCQASNPLRLYWSSVDTIFIVLRVIAVPYRTQIFVKDHVLALFLHTHSFCSSNKYKRKATWHKKHFVNLFLRDTFY